MKRGMLLPVEAPRLRFGDYPVLTNLPVVPKVFGHVGAAQPPSPPPPGDKGWGNIGNRLAGNCPIAGAGHETQTWRWATGQPIPPFTDASGIADYSRALVAAGGLPYDPSNPATDTGLDPVVLASWRQTVGITDAAGGVHKIGPFSSIANLDELDLACYLFGAAAFCWNLPASAEDQFARGEPWDDTSGPGVGGHYTAYVGRNSAGNRMVVTWGRLQAVTDAYIATYMYPAPYGGIAYLSREYLLATGNSPEAFNFDQLNADMAQIRY